MKTVNRIITKIILLFLTPPPLKKAGVRLLPLLWRGLGRGLFFLFPLTLCAQTTVSTMQGTYTNGEYVNTSSITISPGTVITPGSGQSVYIHITAVNCQPLATVPGTGQNYIMSSVPRTAGYPASASTSCDVMQTVQYFDGLGRPLQTVQVHGSGDGTRDLVQPIAYDQFGREAVKYLPYAPNGVADGSYRPSAPTDVVNYYNNTPPAGTPAHAYPYSQAVFEPSPLDRPLQQGAPGNDWQPAGTPGTSSTAGHTVQTTYGTNAANEVMLWAVNGNGAGWNNTYYAAGQLYKTISADENGNQTIAYKDKEDRVVCKKVQADNSGTFYSTSYIYNDLEQLSYVVPQIPGSYPASFTETTTDANFTGYIYAYHYDDHGRVAEKKIPGKGWEYTAYNPMDQPVATQDGNQRLNNKWTFTKYDGVGRAIMTGEITDTRTHQAITDAVTAQAQSWEAPNSGGTNGYTNTCFPTGWNTLYTVNYYDNYTYPGAGTYAPATTTSAATQGLLTGSLTNILGTGTMLLTELYYDDKGRLQESIAQNHIGGYDRTVNTYNFNNQIVNTTRTHNSSTVGSLTIANSYVYDNMGRRVQTTEQINGGQQVTISQANFNDVGQLLTKNLGGGLQAISYGYNERGWMTAANTNSSLFNLGLKYNQPDAGITSQYNGNIAEMLYGGQNSGSKTFSYSYDNLNRLTSAQSTNSTLNETNITYDALGNLQGLTRGSYGSLGYFYAGNQLTAVSGYSPRSYAYDANGNATSDGVNKSISYNYLNLPATVGSVATYTYDATGNKLTNTGSDGRWDYLNGITYFNNAIKYITTEEGRATPNGGNYAYQYDLKDHLGDVRVTFDSYNNAARVLQEDEYYAFGLRHSLFDNANNNRHLYNGKEIQVDLTNQYDYGARFYDPVIARWTSVDPLAELERRGSPYNYTFDDPVRYTDPDGMFGEEANENNDDDPQVQRSSKATESQAGRIFKSTLKAAAITVVASGGPENPLGDGVAVGEVVLGGAVALGVATWEYLHSTPNIESVSPSSIVKDPIVKSNENNGRTGRQQRLKDVADDPKESSANRGWVNQEKNQIERGKSNTIRNPPGKELAHNRGKEAAKGYNYKHSKLQDQDLHRLQHKHDNKGKKNKENPN